MAPFNLIGETWRRVYGYLSAELGPPCGNAAGAAAVYIGILPQRPALATYQGYFDASAFQPLTLNSARPLPPGEPGAGKAQREKAPTTSACPRSE